MNYDIVPAAAPLIEHISRRLASLPPVLELAAQAHALPVLTSARMQAVQAKLSQV